MRSSTTRFWLVLATVLTLLSGGLHPVAQAADPVMAGTFVGVTPARVLDTRTGLGVTAAGPLPSNGQVVLTIAGRGGVPASVGSVALNITVTGPSAAGHVTAYPSGGTMPDTSNVNFTAGQTVPNMAIVKVGTDGKVVLTVTSAAPVHLIADVYGYFLPGTPTVPGSFAGTSPARLLDTRIGLGVAAAGPLPSNGQVVLTIAGRGGLPATVGSVALNITVTGPGAAGHVTAYPSGGTMPDTSNVNFTAGQTVPNMAIVKVGTDGKIILKVTSAAPVHLIADVSGYFLPGAPTTAGSFAGMTPARLLDTRIGLGVTTAAAVPAGGQVILQVAGRRGVPTTVGSVVLNITVTGPGAAGHITTYPSGGTMPDTSNVNFTAGQTVPNMAIVKVGTDGKIILKVTSAAPVHLIADVSGFYLAADTQVLTPAGCLDPMTLVFDTRTGYPNGGPRVAGFTINRGTSPVSIDWGGPGTPGNTAGGPGQLQTFATSPDSVSYTYSTDGTFTVLICGSVPQFGATQEPTYSGLAALVAVTSFGDVGLTDLSYGFWGAENLVSVPAALPPSVSSLRGTFKLNGRLNDPRLSSWDTTNVTDMNGTFWMATAFNQPLSGWTTSSVTDMGGMFYAAAAFNQPIGSWDTGNVIDMTSMFSNARTFNQPLGSWNTGRVTSMPSMFSGASAFNQPLGAWNTASVTDMRSMFASAWAFNQPLGTWNTSKVTDMNNMFAEALVFNQPLGSWNTGQVTSMSGMFAFTSAFDQALDTWDTSNVTTMSAMFMNATGFNHPVGSWNTAKVTSLMSTFEGASAFNQPLNSWTTSSVTSLHRTFHGAAVFDQPLDAWDTSRVIDLTETFAFASSFDQPLSTWTTGSVENMTRTFQGATVFNQSLSTWDVRNVRVMYGMLTCRSFSTENYDALLMAWSAQVVQQYVTLDVYAFYSPRGAAGRQTLVDTNLWIISDRGPI